MKGAMGGFFPLILRKNGLLPTLDLRLCAFLKVFATGLKGVVAVTLYSSVRNKSKTPRDYWVT
jgi:hypothetical protein